MNRLSCGVWRQGDRGTLAALGVRHVVFHRGLYRQAGMPGAWFAWRGLQAEGYRPAGGTNDVTYFAEDGEIEAPPVPAPQADRPVLCEGWREGAMVEREASFWINGGGTLEVHVSAAGSTSVRIWVDGRPSGTVDVARTRTFTVPLGVARWHSVALEIPRLFPTKPPSGLRIVRLIVKP
jgi:hypothetical protein